jgi:hypothetical protein
MKSSTRTALSLAAAALGLALTFSPAQAAPPDDSAQKAAPDSTQATDDASTVAAAKPTTGIRTTRTGSHIARVRSDGALPVSEYDRTYIDRTGAATTADMLRTIPQVQVGR